MTKGWIIVGGAMVFTVIGLILILIMGFCPNSELKEEFLKEIMPDTKPPKISYIPPTPKCSPPKSLEDLTTGPPFTRKYLL